MELTKEQKLNPHKNKALHKGDVMLSLPNEQDIMKKSKEMIGDDDQDFCFREGARWMRAKIIELNKRGNGA